MPNDDTLREGLARQLDWQEAHHNLDTILLGWPPALYGVQPEGLPYSGWQLLEHLRIAQHDILDFCRNPDYTQPDWPDDYWPREAAPPSPGAWDDSLMQIRSDRRAMQKLIHNTDDLFATIPHGEGQTYLREALLLADHNAYHLGQLLLVRRLLGIWPPS